MIRYIPVADNVPSAPVPRDSVTRKEADAVLAQLQVQIGAAAQRTEELVNRVEDTRKTAMGQVKLPLRACLEWRVRMQD